MKLKVFIAAAIATLALAVGCTKETQPELSQVKVDKSYVGIPAEGGSVVVTVNAQDSWEIKGAPDWLTISPATGAAGETKVTFSAEAAKSTREGSVQVACAGVQQNINVVQMTEKVELAVSTCAAVIAGPDSQTYKIKGVCTAIANTTYGNFYINDGTGSVYVYGTVDATGSYNWASFGIEVGDIVCVEGPKTTYNGTVELVDATFISVTKSLLKVDKDAVSVAKEGGDVLLKIVYKGNGLNVKPQSDFLSLKAIDVQKDTTYVTVGVAENTGDPRVGEVLIESAISGQASSATVKVSQAGVQGTLATPFTVAQAIEYVKALNGTTTEDFYVKGIVTKVQSQFSAQYGNGTFWISDDGTCSVSEDGKSTTDTAHDFEVYRALWFNNVKWAEGNAPISVGDEVLICGKLTIYNGLGETASGKAYVYSVNGLTSDAEGLGSLESPLTVKGAIAAAANSPANVYVKGKISYVTSSGLFNASYGNATFWISDDGKNNGVAEDGKSTTAKDLDFEVYRTLYLGNRKWVEGDTQIAAGDEVIIKGALTVYNGLSETASGKSYIYSLNGKTE